MSSSPPKLSAARSSGLSLVLAALLLVATSPQASADVIAQADADQTDADQTDADQTDADQTDAAQTDAAQTDADQTDAAQADAEDDSTTPPAPPAIPPMADAERDQREDTIGEDCLPEEDCFYVFGWDDPPPGTPPRSEWPDTGAAFYVGIGMLYLWPTGQLEEVLVEGGPGGSLRIGAALQRWVLTGDVRFASLGSRFEDRLTSMVTVGMSLTHRIPLSWSWTLLVSVGGNYNWLSQCDPDGGDVDECPDVDDPNFAPEGPGLDFELGLAWSFVQAQQAPVRLRSDVFLTTRLSTVWLDNDPAQRTIQGTAVLTFLGIDTDMDLF